MTKQIVAIVIPKPGEQSLTLPATRPALPHDPIFGADLGVLCGRLPPMDVDMHRHDFHGQLLLPFAEAILDFTWRDGDGEQQIARVAADRICLIAPGVEHGFSWREPASMAVFYPGPSFLRPIADGLQGAQLRQLNALVEPGSLASRLASMFHNLSGTEGRQPDQDFVLTGGRLLTDRLLEAYGDILRRGGGNSRLSKRQQDTLLAYLDVSLDRSVEVEELAALVFLSKAHFIRLFTRTFGEPPVRYHLIRRLKKAEEMLLQTDCSILDVVHEFGFGEQSYFNRCLLKHLNCRPGALLRLRGRLFPE